MKSSMGVVAILALSGAFALDAHAKPTLDSCKKEAAQIKAQFDGLKPAGKDWGSYGSSQLLNGSTFFREAYRKIEQTKNVKECTDILKVSIKPRFEEQKAELARLNK